jgi:hypothetical protein
VLLLLLDAAVLLMLVVRVGWPQPR